MINILPPELKEQIVYSKRNVIARNYLFALIIIALLVGAALTASHIYANQQISNLESDIERAAERAEEFEDLEASVSTLNTQLQAIDKLIEQRPQFALLLEDIASVLPPGSYINGISLSEDMEDQPMQLQITAQSQQQAISVRDELLESNRIQSADIQNVSDVDEDGTVNVSVVIAFDPEEAI